MPEKYIGRMVQIIYQDKKGNISKRRIRVQTIADGKVRAFDLEKHSPRFFETSRILAVQPVIGRAG